MPRFNKKSKYNLNKAFSDSAGNLYKSPAHLRMHLKFPPYESAPTDHGPFSKELTLSYDSTPIAFHPASIGDNRYDSFTTSDSDGANGLVLSSTGILSFGSTAEGVVPSSGAYASDGAFSVSAWINVTTHGANNFVLAKDTDVTGHTAEYELKVHSDGKIRFKLGGGATGLFIGRASSVATTVGRWYHVVATYPGGVNTGSGIRIYIDGVARNGSLLSNGTWTGMARDDSEYLAIGASSTPADEFDGQIAEVALWGTELTAAEALAIYNITRKAAPTHTSGIVNNPPRTLLRDRDNVGGVFPLVRRPGDKDFSLKGYKPFDDVNTVDFVSNFAEAKIIFNSEYLDNGTWIGLTGSLPGGSSKNYNFVFINGAGLPADLQSNQPGPASTIKTVDLGGSRKTISIAFNLASEINSSKMGIKARAVRNAVLLEQSIPHVGSRVLGNTILSGNINNFGMPSDDPFEVFQFANASGTIGMAYPHNLPSGHKLLNQLIAEPHSSPNLIAPGVCRPNIFTPDPKLFDNADDDLLSPFDDSRIEIVDNEFFNTGTQEGIMFGFSSPLKSKTQIVFSMNSASGTYGGPEGAPIFFSTGAMGYKPSRYTQCDIVSIGSGSGMAYWNNGLDTWQMLQPKNPPQSGGALVVPDIYSGHIKQRMSGCLGFSPNYGGIPFNPRTKRIEDLNGFQMFNQAGAVGHPIKEFGFPIARQYNATSSQCYNMSDYIDSPFLLEKMVLDIEGIFALPHLGALTNGGPIQKQFFVLNQMTNPDSPHYNNKTHHIRHHTQLAAAATSPSVSFTQDGIRELIGYAKIAFLPAKHKSLARLSRFKRRGVITSDDLYDALITHDLDDLTGDGDGSPGGTNAAVHYMTGSFRVEFKPSVASHSNNVCELSLRTGHTDVFAGASTIADAHSMVLTNDGGADLHGNLSGRQLASSFVNTPIQYKTLRTSEFNVAGTSYRKQEMRNESRTDSPYLLQPEDKIIFGYQNHPISVAAAHQQGGTLIAMTKEEVIAQVTDQIKKAKVTFFGSLVANGKETHYSPGQPLTTNSVYEAIGDDKVLDQYDVASLEMLSGSTAAQMMTDRMLSGARRRRADIARGNAGSTGSLQRVDRFTDDTYLYRDSLPLPVSSLFGSDGVGITTIAVAATDGGTEPTKIIPVAPISVYKKLLAGGSALNVAGVSVALSVLAKNLGLMNSNDPFNVLQETIPSYSDEAEKSKNSTAQYLSIAKEMQKINVLQEPKNGQGAGSIIKPDGSLIQAHDLQEGVGVKYEKKPGMAPSGGWEADAMAFSVPDAVDGGGNEFGGVLDPAAKIVAIGENGVGTFLTGSYHDKLIQFHDEALGIGSVNLLGAPMGIFESPMWYNKLVIGMSANIMSIAKYMNGAGPKFYDASGYKYGYGWEGATPPSSFFKRDHFGYYRDMLEQPYETAFAAAANEQPYKGAVQVEFVSRGGVKGVDPESTNSQNLSIFHTSSRPYSDGNAIDRSSTQPDLLDIVTFASEVSQLIDPE